MTHAVLVSVLAGALSMLAFMVGRARGRSQERARCLGLCAQSFQGKTLSTTARRIYNSIDHGRTVLITEDEFFGKPKTPPLSPRAPCKHRNFLTTSAGGMCLDCGDEL